MIQKCQSKKKKINKKIAWILGDVVTWRNEISYVQNECLLSFWSYKYYKCIASTLISSSNYLDESFAFVSHIFIFRKHPYKMQSIGHWMYLKVIFVCTFFRTLHTERDRITKRGFNNQQLVVCVYQYTLNMQSSIPT